MIDKAKITVAVPTYKRNDLLLKTLNCLKNQTYKNINVYVSNNSTEAKDIEEINKIKENMEKDNFHFHLIHQKTNIGAINNLLFLLSLSKTKYFMWLCDDDEISPMCLEILIKDIENNNKAISIVPYWAHIIVENNLILKKPVTYMSNLKIFRIIKFLYKADDAFFYSLHKTEFLKKCKYYSFWSINKNIINWAYPYLFQLIINGQIALTSNKKAIWYNHEYSFKHTLPKSSKNNSIWHKICYAFIKKVNVHFLYSKYIIEKKNIFLIILYFLISPIFLIIDLIKIFKFNK